MMDTGGTENGSKTGVVGEAMLAELDTVERSTRRRMGRLVNVSRVALVIVVLATYLGVAESLGFCGLAYLVPGKSMITTRMTELGVLWVILWSALGWKVLKIERLATPFTDWVIVAAVPLVAGLVTACWRLVGMSPMRMPGLGWWWDWVPVAFPLILAAYGTGLLLIQGWAWRKYAAKPLHGCRSCAYDLTGNQSGVCPECGTTVVPTREEIARARRKKGVIGILCGIGWTALGWASVLWPDNPLLLRSTIAASVFLLSQPDQ